MFNFRNFFTGVGSEEEACPLPRLLIIEIMLDVKKKLFQNVYHIANVKQQVTP